MPKTGQIIKKLWDELGSDECWPWLGSINKRTGYGKKTFHRKDVLAHRWMYEQRVCKIADGMVINHLCRNRRCVNPSHLEVVTQQDNCKHGAGCKLTEEQVTKIKNMKNQVVWGEKKHIAKYYGVTPATISDIWYGRSWN